MEEGLGELRRDVREAAAGVTARFGRAEWLACARRGEPPRAMWEAMAGQGILGLGVPEEYGGSGGGITAAAAAVEALAGAGIPPIQFLLTAFSREPVLLHGSDVQRKELLPATARGDCWLAFALTEPDAGSNTFRTATTATRSADGYVLNGQKIFISGADEAHILVALVRTTPMTQTADRRQGLSLLLVDRDAPGVQLRPMDIGILAPERQFEVFFTDVEAPSTALIGEEGAGFRYLFDALNPERLLVSAWAVGLGDFVLEKAAAYARERAPFGPPIGSYQGVQHKLALAKAHLDAARLMLYHAAAVHDTGGSAGTAANTAKLLSSQAAVEACNAAIQTHGGYAFTDEYDVSTVWPMARLLEVAPLNNEMILNFLGEHVLRLPKSY
jgi:alkylation response protein AidB-like acyl-CoA dehydrogenase